MKCLIVDDEHLARQLLASYLDRMPGMELVGSCEDALSALKILREQPIDVLLLDIQLPDLTGLELLKTLSHTPQVILITAYAEHALQGFELDVADYLLKPVSFERFVQAINKVALRLEPSTPIASPLSAFPQPLPTPDHIFVKVDYQLLKIRFADIRYIEGMREYVSLQTAERRHLIYQSLRKLEELLSDQQFVRVHKSYLVSLPHIDRIHGNTLFIGEKEIPIGKSYKEAFMQRIETW